MICIGTELDLSSQKDSPTECEDHGTMEEILAVVAARRHDLMSISWVGYRIF